ncbi:MAG: Crp/Fnr family transcriptional regulator [Acidimicrobiia bacterium]
MRQAAWVARCVGRGAVPHLSPSDLELLAAQLSTVKFSRGDVVFGAGQMSTAVWVVRSGSIGLFAGTGSERVILAILRPGDLDGDVSTLLGMPQPYSAEALEDSICHRLASDQFGRMFGQHPELARRWLTAVAGRLAASQQRLVDLLGVPLAQQVARVVLDEAVERELPYSQATIAALLGARRPSVNKVVNDLQRRGVIDVGYRSIRIVDAAALLVLAGRHHA